MNWRVESIRYPINTLKNQEKMVNLMISILLRSHSLFTMKKFLTCLVKEDGPSELKIGIHLTPSIGKLDPCYKNQGLQIKSRSHVPSLLHSKLRKATEEHVSMIESQILRILCVSQKCFAMIHFWMVGSQQRMHKNLVI